MPVVGVVVMVVRVVMVGGVVVVVVVVGVVVGEVVEVVVEVERLAGRKRMQQVFCEEAHAEALAIAIPR
jgi:hypothetical protein